MADLGAAAPRRDLVQLQERRGFKRSHLPPSHMLNGSIAASQILSPPPPPPSPHILHWALGVQFGPRGVSLQLLFFLSVQRVRIRNFTIYPLSRCRAGRPILFILAAVQWWKVGFGWYLMAVIFPLVTLAYSSDRRGSDLRGGEDQI